MGTSYINGSFSMAMLNNQRVPFKGLINDRWCLDGTSQEKVDSGHCRKLRVFFSGLSSGVLLCKLFVFLECGFATIEWESSRAMTK